MIFLECLFGMLNFIPAGGKPGIVTAWITLFPNVVQKLRGSGEACCAFQVAEYAIRQIVFGKELIGKGEIGCLHAHLGSHVDRYRRFAGSGDSENNDVGYVILRGLGAVVVFQAVVDCLHPPVHVHTGHLAADPGKPQCLGIEAVFQSFQEKGISVEEFHFRDIEDGDGFRIYDGTENERSASGGTLQDIVHNFFGVCHRRDERKFFLIEIDFGKLADKGLAEAIDQNAGTVRNVVYVFRCPHVFSLPKRLLQTAKEHNSKNGLFTKPSTIISIISGAGSFT